jgi:hypothetical protein
VEKFSNGFSLKFAWGVGGQGLEVFIYHQFGKFIGLNIDLEDGGF